MLQIRRTLLSGLVALLMVGMVSAADSNQDEADQFIGGYIGSWAKTDNGRECSNTQYWQCVRFIFDVSIPW